MLRETNHAWLCEVIMKVPLGTITGILILSLAVVVFLRWSDPDLPLTQNQVIVVVGICAGAVVAAKRIWNAFRKPKTNGGNQ